MIRAMPPPVVMPSPIHLLPPSIANEFTMSLGWGSQAVGVPVVASMAATQLRFVAPPPNVVKAPPTSTFEPSTRIALTKVFGWGSQAVGTPVAASMAARQVRLIVPPLRAVKSPPAYTVPPLTASAPTRLPLALGSQAVGTPVVALIAAMWLRTGDAPPPKPVNPPPTYTMFPSTAIAFTDPLRSGFQAVGAPVVASSAATRLRVVAPPPKLLKNPPA